MRAKRIIPYCICFFLNMVTPEPARGASFFFKYTSLFFEKNSLLGERGQRSHRPGEELEYVFRSRLSTLAVADKLCIVRVHGMQD